MKKKVGEASRIGVQATIARWQAEEGEEEWKRMQSKMWPIWPNITLLTFMAIGSSWVFVTEQCCNWTANDCGVYRTSVPHDHVLCTLPTERAGSLADFSEGYLIIVILVFRVCHRRTIGGFLMLALQTTSATNTHRGKWQTWARSGFKCCSRYRD